MSSSAASAITGMSLERVVAQMPAAVVVVEAPSGRIVHLNARARDMTERQLGRPMPAELTGDWEIFHPDGRPYTRGEWPLVRSLTSGEEVADEEYFNVLPDGSRMIVRASSSPIYDDERRIVAGVLVMTDITERKRQEERLRYLAGLLDTSEDAIVALDAGWVVTVWNKGAERLYGWTAEEVVGRHTLEVARLEMTDEDRAGVRHAAAEHGRWRGEVVACRKDGSTVCVELIVGALHGERGEVTGYLGIHRDMTERKRGEEALREARRRSETILESITDAFFTVDREWRFTYVNERILAKLRRVWGRDVSAAELVDRSCWDVFPETVGTALDRGLHSALHEQRAVEFEAYAPTTQSWVEVRASPSKDGLSVSSHDISARKAAQAEVLRRAEQQALVAALGGRALASDDLQSLLDEAVGLVARTLDVELAGVAEMPADGEEVILRAGVGWREGVVGRRIERGGRDSQVGYTLLRRRPVIAEEQATDRRFKPSAMAQEHGVVSALTVMIETPDEPFGVLEALSSRRRTFSKSDINFVQAVANVLAGAVERSRAQQRLIEVREIERGRIARDLHDEALQELTHALALAGRPPAATGLAEWREELTGALRRVGEQLRGAIFDLRLGGEEHTPLAGALEALVEVQRAMLVDCKIELDVRDGVPDGPLGATGVEVLRILGEALTNARRHARARRARVRVWGSPDTLHAEVSDDGRGFDPTDPAHAGGNGMRGMHERAGLLRGRLDISSDPAAGTTVRLEVPLRADDAGAEQKVRVLLVEDHAAVREAIASAFEHDIGFEVTGQAASLAEAREMLEDVDVAVLDLGLPDGSGADLIAQLHAVSPGAQALVLSASLDPAEVDRAIERGAAGAVNKLAHLDEVVEAVRRLRAGETLLPVN